MSNWSSTKNSYERACSRLPQAPDLVLGTQSAASGTPAAVTPISLLAYVILATPKLTIGEDELKRQLAVSLDLLQLGVLAIMSVATYVLLGLALFLGGLVLAFGPAVLPSIYAP